MHGATGRDLNRTSAVSHIQAVLVLVRMCLCFVQLKSADSSASTHVCMLGMMNIFMLVECRDYNAECTLLT